MFKLIKKFFGQSDSMEDARYYKMAREKFRKSFPSPLNDDAYYHRKSDKDYYNNYIPETKEEVLGRIEKLLMQKREE